MLKLLVTVLFVFVIIAADMMIVPVQGQHIIFWVNTVRVQNDLGGNTQLVVHCRSKDDDLGTHNLSSGQSFEWSFRDNFWGTTLFWCNFDWNNMHKSFDIYNYQYDVCNSRCFRSIRPDGAYFYGGKVNPVWEKRYSWWSSKPLLACYRKQK